MVHLGTVWCDHASGVKHKPGPKHAIPDRIRFYNTFSPDSCVLKTCVLSQTHEGQRGCCKNILNTSHSSNTHTNTELSGEISVVFQLFSKASFSVLRLCYGSLPLSDKRLRTSSHTHTHLSWKAREADTVLMTLHWPFVRIKKRLLLTETWC